MLNVALGIDFSTSPIQKLFYPVTGRNEHACMLLIYLLVKLYELQER